MRKYNSRALSIPFPSLNYADIHELPIPIFPNLSSEQIAQRNILNYEALLDPSCPTPNATTFTASLSKWNYEVRVWNNLTGETWDKIFYNIAYGCCNCSCLPPIPAGYMADSNKNCANGPWQGILP